MKELLSEFVQFSDSEYDQLMELAKIRTIRQSDHLLVGDKVVDRLFFIKNGMLRGYRLVNGEDVTHHFFIEKWFATDYESYLTEQPGEIYIEALTEVTVYEFQKSNLLAFFYEYPKFGKIRSIIAEVAYLQMVDRLKNFQNKNLRERYQMLIDKSPRLFHLVPQKHIASYLGVAPQSLSRIKGAK